jgi:transposase
MAMVKKQTSCKNQIKGMLTFYGYNIPDELARNNWSQNFIDWLESLEFQQDSGRNALITLLEDLKHLRQSIVRLTRQIRELSQQEPYQKQVLYLKSIPGISTFTVMVLQTEIVDINRFKGLDRLASYVGLVPGEDSSGEEERNTGISRRRNAYLRYLLIESSWIAVRKDPALLKAFNDLTQRMAKNRAIVRIARKLLNRIRYVLKNQQPYVTCVVS